MSSVPNDVILVLGNGINPDGSLPLKARRRVRRGVELLTQRQAPRLILSGNSSWHLPSPPPRTEAEAMRELAITLGATPDQLLIEDRSKDTFANILFAKLQYFEPHEWREVMVVTSYQNVGRAEFLCRKILGPDYTCSMEGVDSGLDKSALEEAERLEAVKTAYVRDQLKEILDGDDKTIADLLLSSYREYKSDRAIRRWLQSLLRHSHPPAV